MGRCAGDVLEYTITGLHPGRKYEVRVLAGSLNVDGPWYAKEMPRVGADVGGGGGGGGGGSGGGLRLMPPAFHLVSTDAASISVVWTASNGADSTPPAGAVYKLGYITQARPLVTTVDNLIYKKKWMRALQTIDGKGPFVGGSPWVGRDPHEGVV